MDFIFVSPSPQYIVSHTTDDGVFTGTAMHNVRVPWTRSRAYVVIAIPARNNVVPLITIQLIVSIAAVNLVISWPAKNVVEAVIRIGSAAIGITIK